MCDIENMHLRTKNARRDLRPYPTTNRRKGEEKRFFLPNWRNTCGEGTASAHL